MCLTASSAGTFHQTQASLREENDSLRWQLDAYRNEVELLRKEPGKSSRVDDEHAQTQTQTQTQTYARTHSPGPQIQLLQQSLHSMQQVGTSQRLHFSQNRSGHTVSQNVSLDAKQHSH